MLGIISQARRSLQTVLVTWMCLFRCRSAT